MDDFEALVERALAKIPARFRKRMENVAVVVDREPSPAQLHRARVRPGSTLLGLYEGRPLTTRSVFDGFAMPDRITIFQGPHERMAGSRARKAVVALVVVGGYDSMRLCPRLGVRN